MRIHVGLMLVMLSGNAIAASLPDHGWVHWREDAVAGTRTLCCGTADACRLSAPDHGVQVFGSDSKQDAANSAIDIYLNRDGARSGAVLVATPDCHVDREGQSVSDLNDVSQSQSLAWLQTVLAQGNSERSWSMAVQAIAHHATPDATSLLADIAANHNRTHDQRREATFWLGARRGEAGVEALMPLAADGQPRWLRQDAIFALAISKRPAALQRARAIAVDDDDARVRAHAVSSLAITQVPNIAGFLEVRMKTDPAREVREQAMFGLSQLKNERPAAIAALKSVVRDPSFGEERQQALFWLAQMYDPRADKVVEGVFESPSAP